MLVNTIAILWVLQYSILNSSFIEPPGWITSVMPSLLAISTQSGKGKNASLAITAFLREKLNSFAFSIACLRASTRLVCPVPEARSCLFLAKTIVLDLVCLHIFEAKSKSSNADSEGFSVVTYVISEISSVFKSLSCTKYPLRHVLMDF